MSKRKAAKRFPAPSPRAVEDLLTENASLNEVHETCEALAWAIAERALSRVYQAELAAIVQARAVQDSVNFVLTSLECFNSLQNDRGEMDFVRAGEEARVQVALEQATHDVTHVPAVQRRTRPGDAHDATAHVWQAEPEPEPLVIDRWARGCVPVKRRVASEMRSLLLDAPGTPRSVHIPSDTGTHRRMSVARSRLSRSSSRASRVSRSVRAEREPGSGKAVHAEPAVVVRSLPPKKPTESDAALETLRVRELRRLEARRKEREKREAKVRREQEKAAEYERLAHELSGKDYTYDENGNVIIIQVPNPDRMPSINTTPRVAIHDAPEEPEEEGPSRQGSSGARRSSLAAKSKKGKKVKGKKVKVKGKKGKKKVKGKKGKKGGRYGDSRVVQPALVESIKLASGVTVRDLTTGSSRSMPRPKREPRQMTKTQYLELLDSDPTGTIVSDAAPTATAGAFATSATVKVEEEEQQEEEAQVQEEEAQEDGEEEADFNLRILKDRTWGQNPVEPKEPRPHRIPDHGGVRPHSPRPFVARERAGGTIGAAGPVPVSPRVALGPGVSPRAKRQKHLPPPVFPAVSGHGWESEYFGDREGNGVRLPPVNRSQKRRSVTSRQKAKRKPKPFEKTFRNDVTTTPQAQEFLRRLGD